MKLTKLTLVLLLLILTTSVSRSQKNVTFILDPPGGKFIIKDANYNYFILRQIDGRVNIKRNLKLELTKNKKKGVIFKGLNRFIHDFSPSGTDGCNTFLGINSGNFSMSSTIPIESSYNTGIGHSSLTNLTTGNKNTALGYESLRDNESGNHNTALGYASLQHNKTGINNTALGTSSCISLKFRIKF